MKTCAVIGQGFVGGSLTTVLSETYKVKPYVFDIAGKVAKGGVSLGYDNLEDFIVELESDSPESFTGIYFVCLPTPMCEDGSADLSIVESVLTKLNSVVPTSKKVVVIKSTIPPGSTSALNQRYENISVVFNPEFLTEANAYLDMKNQDRIILGGELYSEPLERVRDFFDYVFSGKIPTFVTDSTTAELVKYVANCFLSVKVSFANEIKQVCDKLSVDYDSMISLATKDTRLGNSHWRVPGPDGQHGFGGHCIVRDTTVSTPKGVVLVQDIKPGDIVDSSNHDAKAHELKTVCETHAHLYDGEVIRFTVLINENITQLTCTPEHILPVIRNDSIILLRACDILESDELIVMV